MTQTNSQIREEFKELRLMGGELAEGILKDGTFLSDWWLSKLESLLKQQREDIEKAFGGCKKCYGKGYATEKTGHSGRIGINGKRESWVIDNINPCSCDRGKQIKNLIKEYK